jgi:hypothetical protein
MTTGQELSVPVASGCDIPSNKLALGDCETLRFLEAGEGSSLRLKKSRRLFDCFDGVDLLGGMVAMPESCPRPSKAGSWMKKHVVAIGERVATIGSSLYHVISFEMVVTNDPKGSCRTEVRHTTTPPSHRTMNRTASSFLRSEYLSFGRATVNPAKRRIIPARSPIPNGARSVSSNRAQVTGANDAQKFKDKSAIGVSEWEMAGLVKRASGLLTCLATSRL